MNFFLTFWYVDGRSLRVYAVCVHVCERARVLCECVYKQAMKQGVNQSYVEEMGQSGAGCQGSDGF